MHGGSEASALGRLLPACHPPSWVCVAGGLCRQRACRPSRMPRPSYPGGRPLLAAASAPNFPDLSATCPCALGTQGARVGWRAWCMFSVWGGTCSPLPLLREARPGLVWSGIQSKLGQKPGTFRIRTARPSWRDSFLNDRLKNLIRIHHFQRLYHTGCGENTCQGGRDLLPALWEPCHPQSAPPPTTSQFHISLSGPAPGMRSQAASRASGQTGPAPPPRADSTQVPPPPAAQGQHHRGHPSDTGGQLFSRKVGPPPPRTSPEKGPPASPQFTMKATQKELLSRNPAEMGKK